MRVRDSAGEPFRLAETNPQIIKQYGIKDDRGLAFHCWTPHSAKLSASRAVIAAFRDMLAVGRAVAAATEGRWT